MKHLVIALAMALLAVGCASSKSSTPQPVDSVKEDFVRLHAEWVKQAQQPPVNYFSNSAAYVALPAFRSIVALGRPALPYLRRQMEHGSGLDFMLAYAVLEICGWHRPDFPTDIEQEFRDMILEKMKQEI